MELTKEELETLATVMKHWAAVHYDKYKKNQTRSYFEYHYLHQKLLDEIDRMESQEREIHELSFADDEEKMRDFHEMRKDDFLRFYGYLTEEEYDATAAELAMNKA